MTKFSPEIISTNDLDLTVEVSINGRRYEYFLGDSYYHLPDKRHGRRHMPGKLFNWIKRRGKIIPWTSK